MDMCMDMDNNKYIDMCIGMCMDMCMDMRIDVCMDMRMDLRTDMRTDMYVDMYMYMYMRTGQVKCSEGGERRHLGIGRDPRSAARSCCIGGGQRL